MSSRKAKAPLIRVTSRRSLKAGRKLRNEIGVQKAKEAKAVQERAEEMIASGLDDPEEWTEDKIRAMIKEVRVIPKG